MAVKIIQAKTAPKMSISIALEVPSQRINDGHAFRVYDQESYMEWITNDNDELENVCRQYSPTVF